MYNKQARCHAWASADTAGMSTSGHGACACDTVQRARPQMCSNHDACESITNTLAKLKRCMRERSALLSMPLMSCIVDSAGVPIHLRHNLRPLVQQGQCCSCMRSPWAASGKATSRACCLNMLVLGNSATPEHADRHRSSATAEVHMSNAETPLTVLQKAAEVQYTHVS